MHVDFQFMESGVVNVFLQENQQYQEYLVFYKQYNNHYCSQVAE